MGFRKKELEQFLKLRGINLKGLKQVLLDKVMETVVENDYKTICDLRQTQLGSKKEEPIQNPVLFTRPAENVNATSTQTKAIQNNSETNSMTQWLTGTQTNPFQYNPRGNATATSTTTNLISNINQYAQLLKTLTKQTQNNPRGNATATSTQTNPELNKIGNTVSEQKNLQECALIEIEEIPMEDDKTGLFYIKQKIYTQTRLQPTINHYPLILTDSQYLEILEGRYNVDDLLRFDVQVQLRIFKNDSLFRGNFDSIPQGVKLWFNDMEIPLAVRSYLLNNLF